MSLRMPQTLSTSLRVNSGQSVLEHELLGETALTLGRIGRSVDIALAALAASPAPKGSEDRERLAKAAAKAVWHYFVQRECCGLNDHRAAIADYRIPREVLVRVGAAG